MLLVIFGLFLYFQFKFHNRKDGKRLRRSEFNEGKGSELGVDSSTNSLFCSSIKALLGITGTVKHDYLA